MCKYNEPPSTHKLTTDKVHRYHDVLKRIRRAEQDYGRPPGSARLIAVSKTQPADAIRRLAALGQTAFAENYLQDALAKMAELTDLNLEWHFIGRIQGNKTREIAARFHWVQSLDRLRVATRLNAQRPAGLDPLNICIQVNIDAQADKAGVPLADAPELARQVAALPRLRLRGLMAIPGKYPDFDQQRRIFDRLYQARAEFNTAGLDLDTLSMGMSSDMEAAIAAGATMVRIGTDIFGPRK